MNVALKHFAFRHHILLSLAGFVALVIYWCLGPRNDDHLAQTLSVSAGLIAFIAFVQKQQIEEMRLFTQLFKEFNGRYDGLNEKMNAIAGGDATIPLTTPEHDDLNNYFNLCAEEYLCFKKGFIEPEVWKAWRNGMEFFLKHERIRKKWQEEAKAGSYYGLESETL